MKGLITWPHVVALLRAVLLAALTLLADAQVQGQITDLLRLVGGPVLVPPQVAAKQSVLSWNSLALLKLHDQAPRSASIR